MLLYNEQLQPPHCADKSTCLIAVKVQTNLQTRGHFQTWFPFFTGYYGDGLNAIIVFAVCFMPESNQPNYRYIMDNLFK